MNPVDFRRAWRDRDVRTADLAAAAGLSLSGARCRARAMGLPPRVAGRKRTAPPDYGDEVALLGGRWQHDGRGVQRWTPA